jgi:hypothetical protein
VSFKAYRHLTARTLYSFAPPGAATSISEPFFFPISARASGEANEIFLFIASGAGTLAARWAASL